MAKKKATGSLKNGRDSISKRLGIKVYANTNVKSGSIILRQRGMKFSPGYGCYYGNDFTIYSIHNGIVNYNKNIVNVL